LLGASLDALRAFYSRALDLLDPATALSLVSTECSRLRPTFVVEHHHRVLTPVEPERW
jgi:hypothetical protein